MSHLVLQTRGVDAGLAISERPDGVSSIHMGRDARRDAFVEGLLGTPYETTGRHCWWLLLLVESTLFGRTLPAGPEAMPGSMSRSRLLLHHPDRARWVRHDRPIDGDVVLMAKAPGRDIHCGVYLADRGRVIHTDAGHGVVLDTITELQSARGWRATFYRPASE